jgi:hypothetical protein
MYPSQSIGVARLASIFTVTKFLSSGASVILLAALGIYIFIGALRWGEATKSS